ncbi:MAG: hypothetical protein OHK0048_12050 [Rhodoferax sp.]
MSNPDVSALDALTGGAFTAPTSSERAARIREWLATDPSQEVLQAVFKELSVKDKGAARGVRERLDEIKRSKAQALIAQEWADKARALLDAPRLNVADALAWQRDAARAGAPLSKEPLVTLKSQLVDRVRAIEDAQHRVQVQREAAVLVAQRIEVLSTKPWQEAQAALEALRADVVRWQDEAAALTREAIWPSLDTKYDNQLQAAKAQLVLVWEAFEAAVQQAVAAAQDPTLPLPNVPVWADALRAERGLSSPSAADTLPQVDPARRAQAQSHVEDALAKLEAEVSQGHGKASAGAAQALRAALKDHGRWIPASLEAKANAALAAAGELEAWQRWRANQLRTELVAKAEALAVEAGQKAQGGRKLQETLRQLREQWRLTDQGGIPNQALWKRFDTACNTAHAAVQAWLDQIKAQEAQHRAARLALIEELKAWAQSQEDVAAQDWKAFQRSLLQFSDRWRDAGHVSEKAFAELQAAWKAALDAASAPLHAAQQESIAQRQALIEQAQALAQQQPLRIDVVKSLQQRWQALAHQVPLERRLEQKLWLAFREPIDQAFQRKSSERERAQAALSAHDQAVLDAAHALSQACAANDAQAIRAAMAALESVLRAPAVGDGGSKNDTENSAVAPGEATQNTTDNVANSAAVDRARKVVAVRGDDRPGAHRPEAVRSARGGISGPASERNRRGAPERHARQTEAATRPPRLGDAAFRAQREAIEQAQAALRRLAAQAHGEALTQLLTAWERRDPAQLPSASELGPRVGAGVRSAWAQALQQSATPGSGEALLRLEIAAEVPTPAEDLAQRRTLQLQLLTRRHEPSPAQTWAQDVARLLTQPYDAALARRVQAALKVLLKR